MCQDQRNPENRTLDFPDFFSALIKKLSKQRNEQLLTSEKEFIGE